MDTFRKKYQEIMSDLPNSNAVRVIGELKKNLGGRPLVLYGVGLHFNYFWSLCHESGLQDACVCDKYRKNIYKNGFQILDMQTLVRKFKNAVVLISAPKYNSEIFVDLSQNGFASESIIQFPVTQEVPLETPQNFEQHIESYEWAYNFFEDELSRRVIVDRLKWQLLGKVPSPNTTSDMYYEDGFISLSHDEIFVDCGARDGGTVLQFIDKMKAIGKTYKKIYAFESSVPNHKKTIEALSSCSGVEIVPKGVWSFETELPFFEDVLYCGQSRVLPHQDGAESEYLVPFTSLDVFFKERERDELPTFIKMDIEGSEKEALKGAADIIRRAKPKLAVCAYHKIEDIYELPQTILGIRDDYSFALRAHANGPNYKAGYAPCEAILYAV
jgi:FkbM family methyltransferase